MNQIKIFEKRYSSHVEDDVNEFLDSLEEKECVLIDIKYSTTTDSHDRIYNSCMIIYKKLVIRKILTEKEG